MDQEKKNGPIAVVTGCSRGIGYETTNLLALNGFKVYAGVRSLDSCKKLKSLAKKYKNIIIQEIRLEKDSSIKKFAREIRSKEKTIDIVINNAGLIFFGPIETINPAQFREQFQVNLFGPVLLTQELIPLMRKEKKGHIIFIGSTSGVESHGMYGAYAASKFALEAVCHSLAINLDNWNINVSIVELSATKTLIAQKSLKIGSKLKDSKNPYLNYTKNTLSFLQKLLSNGESPKKIANNILNVIMNPSEQLRYFATEKAKSVFEKTLKDPVNLKWKEEV